ncbi:MAG TPA: DMT family transporter [Devosia sp.]|nr:DMT family transporter [Devosia sp.]
MSELEQGVSAPARSGQRRLGHPYLLLTLAPLFWGGNMVAAKLAVGQVAPFVLLAARFIGALMLVLPFAGPAMWRERRALLRHWGWFLFYGAIGFAAFNALLYAGALYTTAINSSIEQASIPVFVLVGNFLFFRVRGRPLQIVGLVLTIIGVALVATHGDLATIASFTFNQGDLLVLLACLIYGAYALTLRFRPPVDWLSFLGASMAGAVIGALAFLEIWGGGPGALSALAKTSALGWGIIAYVAFLPSLLSQLFFAQGVAIIGPNRASLFSNLLPIFGTILSVLILREALEPYHLIAAVVVVAGIALAEWSALRGK